jgi:uncharacterized membrane protein required for colicin V production
MWLNAIAALVLAACIAAGAWSGALATGLRIATLVLAYAAAAIVGPALAPALGARIGLAGFSATVAACSATFVVAYAVLGIASRFARKLGPRENVGRSPRDRFVGGCFGAVRGFLLALTVVYVAMWFDALRATGAGAVMPEIGDSIAADLTSGVVQTAIESAVDTSEPSGRLAARFAARPAVAAAELQGVIDDPNFAGLRSDARFWNDVQDGNVEAAVQRRSFQAIAYDAQLRQRLAHLGLVPDEAALDPEVFRQSMGQALEEIGPRLRDLRDDPAMQELLADPAVVAMAQQGDTLGLLLHPKFRELVSRIGAQAAPHP